MTTFLIRILRRTLPFLISPQAEEDTKAPAKSPAATLPRGPRKAPPRAPARTPKGLDPALGAAERTPKTIRVSQAGHGQFKTIAAAVASIPKNNKVRTNVWIGPGVYKEKVRIDRFKPFVTFYGTPGPSLPKITFNGTAAKYGTNYSGSLIVEADYFIMANIIVENTAPEPTRHKPMEQAVAMGVSGNKAAFYNCRFISFQDTLFDDRGTHYFHSCYIEGTVDFICGRGKSLYENCQIHSKERGGPIAASNRENSKEDMGYSFVNCKVTGTGRVTLGRPWGHAGRIIYAHTFMDAHVAPEGWELKPGYNTATLYFAEYKNTGPGSALNRRAPYVKKLTEAEARPFLGKNYINAATWLLPPPKL